MPYQSIISPQTRFFNLDQLFPLEKGQFLAGVQVAYRTWGQLNEAGDNAVLVCHAFTGWADLETWWEPLLGKGRALDCDRNFIVCSNVLGSCYGTTGPTSINPKTGQPYGATFPEITIRDMVHLQARLIAHLGIQSLRLVVGGSLGGMQVLEWAALYPDKVQAIVPIATSGRHSAWCIAFSEAQRQAIYADPDWQGGNYSPVSPPAQGLAVARMMAMNVYRSWSSFTSRFGREIPEAGEAFAIANYLQYQGQKFIERFDANTYVTLSRAMDYHDLARSDRSYEAVLQSIQQPTLVIAIASDILYPPVEQQELVDLIPQAELGWLNSAEGHDAFLIDMDAVNDQIVVFCDRL